MALDFAPASIAKAPTFSWWAAWNGDASDLDIHSNFIDAVVIEFDGDNLTFVGSGFLGGSLEVEGSVDLLRLGYPNVSFGGERVSPGLANFEIEVDGDVGRLDGWRFNNVDVEIQGDVDVLNLGQSMLTHVVVEGDVGRARFASSFGLDAYIEDDVDVLHVSDALLSDIYVGGEVNLFTSRGGLGTNISMDSLERGSVVGGGFNTVWVDELEGSLTVRDTIGDTILIGDTDTGSRVTLRGGQENYLEVNDADRGTVITARGGDGNMIRVGEGNAIYRVVADGQMSESFSVTIDGGSGDERFNFSSTGQGGSAYAYGNGGNDVFVFTKSAAQAVVVGGEGADSFLYQGGMVTIGDYRPWEDKLVLDADEPVHMNMWGNDDGSFTVWLSTEQFLG